MDVRRRAPHPALRSVLRSFEERRATLGSGLLTWPLAARPHQIIDIYLGEPFRVRIDGGTVERRHVRETPVPCRLDRGQVCEPFG